jgi:hypothetical protein
LLLERHIQSFFVAVTFEIFAWHKVFWEPKNPSPYGTGLAWTVFLCVSWFPNLLVAQQVKLVNIEKNPTILPELVNHFVVYQVIYWGLVAAVSVFLVSMPQGVRR